MGRLNRAASDAMVLAGAHGATDITGFGLLGHAAELAEASGVTLEIEAEAVPLLEGALDLSERGFVTRALSTNEAYLEDRLEKSGEYGQARYNLLVDAQTSGGLLIALEESALDSLLQTGATGSEAFGKSSGPDTWGRRGRVLDKGAALLRLV